MVTQVAVGLQFELRPAHSLSEPDHDRMYQLMAAHYNAVSHDQFTTDLAWKHAVGLLRDADGLIQGFSTLVLNPKGSGGDDLVLYSGDTIVDREHWGSQELVRGFCLTAGRIHATWPTRRLLWYLLSKGHRTYMYLPLFASRFYPAHDSARHASELAGTAADVSQRLFQSSWQPGRGVVAFPRSLGELKPDLAADTWERRRNAHVAYFLQRNPRFAAGEELVCMTELSLRNLRRTARTFFQLGMDQPFTDEECDWWQL